MRNAVPRRARRPRRDGRAGDAAHRRPRLHGPRGLRRSGSRTGSSTAASPSRTWSASRPGLAEAGFVPFVYSIATFATLRPYEFIRNGPALHGLPVRIVGVGGGFDYGHNGITALRARGLRGDAHAAVDHHVAPADAAQARNALRATADLPGPTTSGSASAATRCRGSTAASNSAALSGCATAATWRSWRSARSPTRRLPLPTCSPSAASRRRSAGLLLQPKPRRRHRDAPERGAGSSDRRGALPQRRARLAGRRDDRRARPRLPPAARRCRPHARGETGSQQYPRGPSRPHRPPPRSPTRAGAQRRPLTKPARPSGPRAHQLLGTSRINSRPSYVHSTGWNSKCLCSADRATC